MAEEGGAGAAPAEPAAEQPAESTSAEEAPAEEAPADSGSTESGSAESGSAESGSAESGSAEQAPQEGSESGASEGEQSAEGSTEGGAPSEEGGQPPAGEGTEGSEGSASEGTTPGTEAGQPEGEGQPGGETAGQPEGEGTGQPEGEGAGQGEQPGQPEDGAAGQGEEAGQPEGGGADDFENRVRQQSAPPDVNPAAMRDTAGELGQGSGDATRAHDDGRQAVTDTNDNMGGQPGQDLNERGQSAVDDAGEIGEHMRTAADAVTGAADIGEQTVAEYNGEIQRNRELFRHASTLPEETGERELAEEQVVRGTADAAQQAKDRGAEEIRNHLNEHLPPPLEADGRAGTGAVTAEGEGKLGGVDLKGKVTAEGPLAEYSATGPQLGENGLEASAQGGAYLGRVSGEGSATLGELQANGSFEAKVGAEGSVNANIGPSGVDIGGEGFAGARATVDGSVEAHGVGASGSAEGWAGIGASGSFNAGFQDGKFTVGGELGAALGVGGKVSGEITIDPGAVAESLSGAADAIGGYADSASDAVGDTAGALGAAAAETWNGLGQLF